MFAESRDELRELATSRDPSKSILTVCHGDFFTSNLLFKRDESAGRDGDEKTSVVLLDFQGAR